MGKGLKIDSGGDSVRERGIYKHERVSAERAETEKAAAFLQALANYAGEYALFVAVALAVVSMRKKSQSVRNF